MRTSLFVSSLFLALSPSIVAGQACDNRDLAEVLVPSGKTTIVLPRAWQKEGGLNKKVIDVTAFCIGKDEVSVAEYITCVDAGVCGPTAEAQSDPTLPVHSITIDNAREFTNWLSDQTGHLYRLPSESEWQYAALAGTDEPYPWQLWGELNRPNIFSSGLVATKTGSENPFGIRDMIGNVAEFVDDCYTHDLVRIPDNGKSYSQTDCDKVLTKGGYYRTAEFALSPFFRFGGIPKDFASPQIGFRVARDVKE